MKYIIILVFSLFTINTIAQDLNNINWISFEEAQELNKSEPRPFFVDVYTDWCGWCKKLDRETFKDSTVVSLINTYFYAVKFDAEGDKSIIFNNKVYENNGNGRRAKHDLAKKLLGNKMSFPSLVFLNQDLKSLSTVGGYLAAEEFSWVAEFLGKKLYINQSYEDFIKTKEE